VPAYLDRDISGSGQDSLSGIHVLYMVIHLTALGPEVRQPTFADTDSIMRAGWVAFGDTLSVIGSARPYWREPMWINFEDLMWTPDPSTNSSTPLDLVASLFRWHLGAGTTAHVYIFGV
jgi:hypothetical protein